MGLGTAPDVESVHVVPWYPNSRSPLGREPTSARSPLAESRRASAPRRDGDGGVGRRFSLPSPTWPDALAPQQARRRI